MTSTNDTRGLLRVAAFAALLGGLLVAVADLQHPFVYGDVPFSTASQEPLWMVHQVMHMVSIALILVALPAIHLAQASRTGRFGLGAYVALLISFGWLGAFTVGITMIAVMPGTELTLLDKGAPPGLFPQLIALCFPALLVSATLFAIASWRARILPRPALVLLALSAPLEVVSSSDGLLPLAGGVAMGIAFVWIGARLWKLARPESTQATPTLHDTGTA